MAPVVRHGRDFVVSLTNYYCKSALKTLLKFQMSVISKLADTRVLERRRKKTKKH